MAPTVRVVVRKAFEHQGQSLSVDTRLDLTPVEAAVLMRRGVIRFARATDRLVEASVVADDTVAADDTDTMAVMGPGSPQPRRRRTYKRRDLQAEE